MKYLLESISREQLEEIFRYILIYEMNCVKRCKAKDFCYENKEYCTCTDNYIAWYLKEKKNG